MALATKLPSLCGAIYQHCLPISRVSLGLVGCFHPQMTYVQASTGHGGWPLTVFLTPERRPIFGATYFPPEDRYGQPGFPKVLQRINEAWVDRREEVREQVCPLPEPLTAVAIARSFWAAGWRGTTVKAPGFLRSKCSIALGWLVYLRAYLHTTCRCRQNQVRRDNSYHASIGH